MKRRVLNGMLALVLAAVAAFAGEAKLQDGDFVAVIGDSITEQKLYSVLIEDYLLMCQPAAKLRQMQFGWGGETAGGYLRRMANDTLPYKPTVVTTCYGMNDGGYRPFDPNGQGKWYRDSQTAVVKKFKEAGVRLIVVGSPGCVDADTFRGDPAQATMYNPTLAKLRDIAKEVAQKEGVVFANVFDPMVDVMTKAKARYGNAYHVAGSDGVHPWSNGHLVMAYAFLKAIGCDGNIGTITVDLAAGKATASDGHKVLGVQDGAVQLESSRYPFCFVGDKNPKSPHSPRGILDLFPFNDELNRLTLKVTGAKDSHLKITWGKESKVFAAADLAKGINLAAEFLDNPFLAPFDEVHKAVRQQQRYETSLIKDLVNRLPRFRQMVPEEGEAFDRIRASASKRSKAMFDAAAAKVVPVKHALRIEAAPEPKPEPKPEAPAKGAAPTK
ncbi:MAG: SGNH/GDSL hydrolase family protein [Candidatus Brocadiae bacterium]|nr:SGNH/GDSL hydrolase family protein [Candidatus Brocadiia bacterium]